MSVTLSDTNPTFLTSSNLNNPLLSTNHTFHDLLFHLSDPSIEDKTVLTVDPDYDKLLKSNRHIQQVRTCTCKKDHQINLTSLCRLERVLTPDAPLLKYKRRANDIKTVNHWGQRKLLLSEIEFLTLHAKENDTVVYAGAAPGTHTTFLSSLFPTLNFVLVDPADFVVRHNPPRIKVCQTFFTDETAKLYANRDDVLFICDIRTADWKVMTEEKVEEAVEADQIAQMRWHMLMKPRYSMLKFRLPWGKGKTTYLQGDIYLPIWGPQTTTETRLMVPKSAQMIDYDHTTYEQQLFHFNVNTRVQIYKRKEGIIELDGLCRCYDCSAEIVVVMQYFCKYRIKDYRLNDEAIDKPGLMENIKSFIDALARHCSPKTGRTLSSVVDHNTRNQPWFKGRLFDNTKGRIIDVDDDIIKRKMQEKKRDTENSARQSRSLTIDQLEKEDPVFSQLATKNRIKRERPLSHALDELPETKKFKRDYPSNNPNAT